VAGTREGLKSLIAEANTVSMNAGCGPVTLDILTTIIDSMQAPDPIVMFMSPHQYRTPRTRSWSYPRRKPLLSEEVNE
jgi:hypothetical protein